MRFATKLGVFAAALVVGSSVYKVTEKVRGGDRHEFDVEIAESPAVPEHYAAAPDSPEPLAALAPLEPLEPLAPLEPLEPLAAGIARQHVVRLVHPDEVRIHTHNSAAFLALRDDQLVAGLSDSIRDMVNDEMRKELAQASATGVGHMIEKAVRSSVTKILEKEIEVPISEIRDIDYRRNRIVIRYKKGEPSGMINLETLKMDGERGLLELFSEADARRLVAAVKGKIR